ncbi:MAG: hypothetical protein ABI579_01765, partial [Candidatus Sumerlaeota bacterium]
VATRLENEYYAIVPGDEGQFIVSWIQHETSVIQNTVHAQKFNLAGLKQWGSDGMMVTSIPRFQFYLSSENDGTGGAFIAWCESVGVSYNAYIQHLDGNGTAIWAAEGIRVSPSDSSQFSPRIIPHANGEAVVCWVESTNPYSDIRAQRLDYAGNSLWSLGGLIVAKGQQLAGLPKVTVAGTSGSSIIGWAGAWGYGTIYAQKILDSGQFSPSHSVSWSLY